jgi:hypothetical protein
MKITAVKSFIVQDPGFSEGATTLSIAAWGIGTLRIITPSRTVNIVKLVQIQSQFR